MKITKKRFNEITQMALKEALTNIFLDSSKELLGEHFLDTGEIPATEEKPPPESTAAGAPTADPCDGMTDAELSEAKSKASRWQSQITTIAQQARSAFSMEPYAMDLLMSGIWGDIKSMIQVRGTGATEGKVMQCAIQLADSDLKKRMGQTP
jgi:hypothetical protein